MKILKVLLLVIILTGFWFEGIHALTDACPEGDGWVKFYRLDDYAFTYAAPEGSLIAETCQRERNSIFYFDIVPPQEWVTITTVTGGKIHYASFRLVEPSTVFLPIVFK